MFPFSVTISVYKNDKTDYVNKAINSIINQTYAPSEIVITQDGPVTEEIECLLNTFTYKYENIKLIKLTENQGTGIAHKIGIEHCSFDYVAIMDADDIAVSDRFEKQMKCFENNNNLDIVGGFISEFIVSPEKSICIRDVPLTDKEIKKYIKRRCPFNHMTIMIKKSSILKAGNYQNWFFNEDYFLYCRMYLHNCMFMNLPDILVNVRVCEEMYKRRGGKKYFISEMKLQLWMLEHGIINILYFFLNISIRLVVQLLLPDTVRGFIFQKFFRKQRDRHTCTRNGNITNMH